MKVERCIFHMLPLLCACLASMFHTPAQSQEVLALENFSERLSKDVPVSGRMLVGAFVWPGVSGITPASSTPRLLWRGANVESAKEPLCVTFASRDGQYYGEGKLSTARLGRLPGPVRVKGEHTPSAEKHLRALRQDELAVLASTGDCRLGTAPAKTTVIHVLDGRDVVTPGGQGNTPEKVTLQLMLNSMSYTLDVEVTINNKMKPATCEPLPDGQRNKAFNTICQLTLDNTATEADLVIKRRRYERGFDPIRFKLAWAPL